MEERIIKDINDLLTQLFQKMKEAGYEWDAEKKELRKIEQKPEEDEEKIDFLVNLIRFQIKDSKYSFGYGDNVTYVTKEEAIDMLNSLRPQPKQEWSKEDEAHIDSLQKRLEGICKPGAAFISTRFAISEDADWLKSLKDRVQPQSHWKPSERQKEALLWCVVHLGGADKQTLGELLEELNKL